MKKSFAAVLVLSSAVAFAQADKKMENKGQQMKVDAKAQGAEMKADANANAMMGWKPAKVTKADKAGLDAFYKQMDGAWMKGDVAAAAELVAPQIMMVTDGSKGGSHAVWTREQWVKEMTEAMAGMPRDMKVTSKHKYTFLSDNLAVSHNDMSSTMGKEKMKWSGADVLMKKDGKWMITSSIEGGWGDMMSAGTGGSGLTK